MNEMSYEQLRRWADQVGESLQAAAVALGRDRGRRNETIAQRITAIRVERDGYRDALQAIADGEVPGDDWGDYLESARAVLSRRGGAGGS